MKIIRIIILVSYIVSGYIYTLDIVDKVSVQWLFLGYLNLISITYINFFDKNKIFKSFFFKSKLSLLFIAFIVFSLLTYFYAINRNEVLINSARWVNVFVAFYVFCVTLLKEKNPLITLSLLIVFGLFFELLATYFQIFYLNNQRQYDFSIASRIVGLTANKNINAASIITKLPFVFYLFLIAKREIVKFISLAFIFLCTFALIYIGSRASLISLVLVIVFYSLFILIFRLKGVGFLSSFKQNLLPILTSVLLGLSISYVSLGFNNSANFDSRLTSISVNQTSTALRLSYYKQAFNHFLENPIIGVGLGNWKVKSIDYDNKLMSSYTVQYHAHNDFLQFLAELGIIGTLLYLGLFILSFLTNIKLVFSNGTSDKYFSIILILSLGAYFVDSNLNFPYARVVNQIMFVSILTGTFLQKHFIDE